MTFDLPPAYHCVAARDGDAHSHARELASSGAEEGTLVYVPVNEADPTDSQSDPRLQFSLIMQPDYDVEATHQLQIVAGISLGEAIASMLTPMTTLRYGWPADIRLNDLVAAQSSIEISPTRQSDNASFAQWAIISITAWIGAPTPIGFTSISALCDSPVSGVVMLETFARNFLSQINRWAEDGFADVSKPWRQRFDLHENELIRIKVDEGEFTGTIDGIELDGSLVMQIDGARRQFAIGQAIAGESTLFSERT